MNRPKPESASYYLSIAASSLAVPPAPILRPHKKLAASASTRSEPKNLQAILPPTSRLGANLKVKGEISGSEDLHIDGTVEGSVQLGEGKIIIGATARLTANIAAGEVVVFGSVSGNVHAKDKIEIKKDASVVGDLTMAQIVIEHGAQFKGSIEINQSAENSTRRLSTISLKKSN